MTNNEIQFILYNMPEDQGKVQVVIKDETLWCTQKAMAQLFDCSTDNIGLHLKNIFATGELNKDSVTEKISATTSDGKNYLTQFYSLDAIIAVGYRVSSLKATRFRQWATKVLHEYIQKGFAMDDERLKQAKTAPEIIYTNADHTKEHMGLQTWKNSPEGRILLSDTKVAKNYLPEKEIRQLERAVTGFFDKHLRRLR